MEQIREKGDKIPPQAEKREGAIMRRRSGGTKKPITKRIWFWPVVALVAAGAIFGGGDDKGEPKQEPAPPARSISDTSSPEENKGPTAEEIAQDYLSKQFELDVTDFKESSSKFEITVSVDGVSDRNDQTEAPEDWQSVQLCMISAQARMSEKLEAPAKETTLYLRDSNDDLMLLAQGGKITFDKYEKKEEPPATSDTQEPNTDNSSAGKVGNGDNFNTYDNPSQQETTKNYVLNTNTMKFHRPSCNSVAKIAPENYSTYNGTRDGAISKGYDPCGKCNP